MKAAGLAINVLRINHGNKVLRFRAWYTVTEKMSVIVDTSSLGEGNTTAIILWSLDNLTEPYSAEAMENDAKHRSQTAVVSSGCSHKHCIWIMVLQ